jgi:hypothetical protein
MIDFEAENRRLSSSAKDWLPQILPGGRFRGHEYMCGSINGGAGDSLSVNTLTGKWADFADPGTYSGNDFLSLIAMARGVSNVEAAKMMGAQDVPKLNGSHGPAPEEEVHVERPPQADFRPDMFRHPQDGTPSRFWVYRETDGAPIFVVARYDPEGKKKLVRPWIWTGLKWRCQAPPKPRPLYNLPSLSHTARVLLVEGEKAADAAAHYFPARPCLTWMGGVQGWKHADWQPLAGREVTLWPDADDPGRGCMALIAARLLELGCKVWVVETDTLPDRWDLADAVAEGWDREKVVEYAKPHTKLVAPPDDEPDPFAPPEPAAPDVPGRVQRLPPPGGQTLEPDAPEGSLRELWQSHFVLKSSGAPYMCLANAVAAIGLIPDCNIWYDEFAHRIMLGKQEWRDENAFELTLYMQRKLGLNDIRSNVVAEAVEAYAWKHRRNPPREWLNSLIWDGTDRLRLLLSSGMGTVLNRYTEAVGRCFMEGMVARVMRPGCKVDAMPIFEGAQGAGKSTALSIIGGEYFAEIHESITSKDFYIAITGKMLCEISELHAFRRAELERVKGIITTGTDRFRTPYGRYAVDHPRSCVFAGTTNSSDWNTDETGARRFWPVECGEIDRDWLSENRQQLFAEAVARFNRGEAWWDVPEEEAGTERKKVRDFDPWQDLMRGYMDANNAVSIPYIMENILQLAPRDQSVIAARRVGKILRQNGFQNKVQRTPSGESIRRWIKY